MLKILKLEYTPDISLYLMERMSGIFRGERASRKLLPGLVSMSHSGQSKKSPWSSLKQMRDTPEASFWLLLQRRNVSEAEVECQLSCALLKASMPHLMTVKPSCFITHTPNENGRKSECHH